MLPPIEIVSIDTIRPYWRNPRKNEQAIPAVRESIERYGLNQPLVVDAKGVIVVGHTRYRALLEIGVDEVPVVRPKLTAKQAKEYRIADNKTSELAEWDKGMLIPELRGMSDGAMAPFFDESDLLRLLAESAGNGNTITDVDDARMDGVLDRHENRMADLTKARIENQMLLECPHCGEEFYIDRSSLLNHPGETA